MRGSRWLTLICFFCAGLPRVGWTAFYYNVGAFWHAPAPANCSPVALVQSNENYNYVSPTQITSTLNGTTAGNLLVAVVFDENSPATTLSLSDTQGNTWYATPEQQNTNSTAVQIFYAAGIAGGVDTVTVNQLEYSTSGQPLDVILFEYSGLATSLVVDAASGQANPTAASSASTGPMVTTSNCKDLIVAAFAHTGENFTQTPGMTQRTGGNSWYYLVEDNAPGLTSAGTINTSAVLTNTVDGWVAVQVAFRSAGSATPSAPTQLAFSSAPRTVGTTWQCSPPVTVQSQDGSGQPAVAHVPIPITLSSANLTFYAESTCTTPITSTSIPAGSSTQSFYFTSPLTGSMTASVSSSGFTTINQTETISAIYPFTWTGGASCDGNWGTSACWQNASVPGSSDTAIFDANCSSHCAASVSADATVGNLEILAGSDSLTVPSGRKLTVKGNTVLKSGSFTLNGTLQNAGDYTATSGVTLTAAASSSLIFSDTVTNFSTISHAVVAGTGTYGNVSIVDAPNGNSPITRLLAPGSTMNVSGNLTLGGTGACTGGNGFCELSGGTIRVAGNVIVQDDGYIGSSEVRMVGSSAQTLDASATSTAFLPSLAFASSSTITVKGSPIVSSSYAYASGTIDFTTFSAPLIFGSPDHCANKAGGTIDPGTIVYGDVKFLDLQGCAGVVRTMTNGSTMNIGGNLVLDAQNETDTINSGTLSVSGNVAIQNNGYYGTTALTLTGSNPATFSAAPGAFMLSGNVVVSKPGATLTFLSDVTYTDGGQSFSLTNGSMALGGHVLSTNSTLSLAPGTTLSEGASCNLSSGPKACTCTSGCGTGTPSTLPSNTGIDCGSGHLVNNGTISCP